MAIHEGIELALRSDEPVNQLRSLAIRLASDGLDRDAILEVFENSRRELRSAHRESDEDVVMDVMDFLVGWCSPHMKLSP